MQRGPLRLVLRIEGELLIEHGCIGRALRRILGQERQARLESADLDRISLCLELLIGGDLLGVGLDA